MKKMICRLMVLFSLISLLPVSAGAGAGRDAEITVSEPNEVRVEDPNKREKPVSPLIISPEDNVKKRDTSITLQWQPVKDVATYHLQIARDRAFTKRIAGVGNLKGPVYQLVNMAAGDYFFRLSSVMQDGSEGDWSPVRALSIVPPLPPPTVLKTETADKIFCYVLYMLEDGVTYQIQVARDEGFTQIIADKKMQNPEMFVGKPRDPGVYYLRVRGVDAEQHAGSFSKVERIEIKKALRPLFGQF